MRPELIRLKEITIRGRMAYALACLEALDTRLQYASPKFDELLKSLWLFTETDHLPQWCGKIYCGKWSEIINFGYWIGARDTERRVKPAFNAEPFTDIPEELAALMGLCIVIGEAHLYSAFDSTVSDGYLEKILAILDKQGIQPPPLDRFELNGFANDRSGLGFLAPRSFYMRA